MAKATYWQRGETIDYANAGNTDIEANTIAVFGNRVGVVGNTIPAGGKGVLHLVGCFIFPKKDTSGAYPALTAGATVYWDATNGAVTTTASTNAVVGQVVEDSGTTEATVICRIG